MMIRIYTLLLVCLLLPATAMAQDRTIDGYKGIWFSLGQPSTYGDKYSGGLGTYTSSHVPMAVYAKAVNKTFFVYGGTTAEKEKHLLIMISWYDHAHHTVPKPVIVYDKQGVDDPHDNASLSLDDKGYIWVFVSGRNTTRPGLLFKSTSPYAIDSFQLIRQTDMTYPQPWYLTGKGFFYLFTKYTHGRELYWSTSPDGIQWSADQQLAGMGGHYQVSNVWKNKIVTVFNYHPGGDVDKRTNCYLLQTADFGKTWTTISGKPVTTPLKSAASEALVHPFDKEGKLVYINDLNFDEQGNPVILAVLSKHHQPGPQGDPHEWVTMHYRDHRWSITRICTSTHNYDMGSLYITGKRWQIIGPTMAGPQHWGTGGEMVSWESKDEGIHWQQKQVLTHNSLRNHSYARRPLHAQAGFYAFWADGDADKLSLSKMYFSTRDGKVYELPYEMHTPVAHPVPLR